MIKIQEKFFGLLLLISACSFTSCTKHTDSSPAEPIHLRFLTKDQALSSLPEVQKNTFIGWSMLMTKRCSLEASFLLPVPPPKDMGIAGGVDGNLFMQRTNNSLLLDVSSEQASTLKEPSFFIFGAPVPHNETYNQQITISTPEGLLTLEARLEDQRCKIIAGGVEVYSTPLFSQIPLQYYYREQKKQKFASSVPIIGDADATSQGITSLTNYPVIQAARAGLEVESRFADNTPNNNGIQNAYIDANLKLVETLHLESMNSASQYFGGYGIIPEFLSVRIQEISDGKDQVKISQASPFGADSKIFAPDSEVKALKVMGEYTIKTRWIIKPAHFEISGLANSADRYYWPIDVVTKFKGSVSKGGTASLISATLGTPVAVKADEASNCFISRFQSASLFKGSLDPNLVLSPEFSQVARGCEALTPDLVKDAISSDKVIPLLVNLLSEAVPSRTFFYSGWDLLYQQLITRLVTDDPNVDLIKKLNPPNGKAGQLIRQTADNLNFFLKDGTAQKSTYARDAFVTFGIIAALRGVDITQIRVQLSQLAEKVAGYLEKSFVELVNNFFISQEEKNGKTLEEGLKLSKGQLDHIKSVGERARSIGLDYWTRYHIDSYFQSLHPELDSQLANWDISLNGIRSFITRENARLGNSMSPEVSDNRQRLFSTAMEQSWSDVYFQYLEKYFLLSKYLPDCSSKRDVASFFACISFVAPSTAKGGILFVGLRDEYWRLANQLYGSLEDLGAADTIAQKIVKQYYSPIWGQCSLDTFKAKNYILQAHIQKYRLDRKVKDSSEFQNSLDSTLANCGPQ